MTDSGTMRLGRFAWGLAVAGLLLGSSGAALAASLPDLKVTALTNPPSTALPGESFAVTATIKNGGAVEAPASTTIFSLSKDKKTATKDLKGVQILPALPATKSITSVATVAIAPGTPAGVYYLQACADGPAKISEASESNNCKWTAETITVFALPDLVVTTISDPPAAAPPGQSFKVKTTTTKNLGMVPSAATTTKYSLVSTSTAAQVDLDGAQSVPALSPGGIFTGTDETVTVRGDTPLGEYRLQACADAGKAISEDDEADNCLLSAGTILVATLPDLRLSTVTLADASLVVTPGSTIDVGAVVQNAGVGDAGASTITFALVNTAGTARILTGTQAVPVVASGTSTSTQTTVTVPSETPFATYTVRACIDAEGAVPEASDANNCTSAPGTVKVAAELKPDLIVAALTDAPTSVLPSETFTATATIKNQGAAASLASTTKFNLVGADGLTRKNLKGVQSVAALAAGASDGPAVTLKVYGDTVPGAYFFQACADGAEEVAEAVETNNCVTLPRGIQVRQSPDLLATAVSDPPATATQGQSIAVTSTIQNVGTVTATESTTRYYLVATDGSGKLDLKGKPILPAIDPGHSFTEKDTVGVRLETVPGSYFLQACADSKKVLAEKNENNNCVTSAKSILVTERPDLVITSVVLKDPQPISVGLNGVISVEVVVQNLGPGPAGESALRLFLIDPAGVSKDLKGHPSVSELATTKSRTVKGTVKVFRDTKLGKGYTLRACADYAEVLAEIDETNNCAEATGTIEVTPEVIVPVP